VLVLYKELPGNDEQKKKELIETLEHCDEPLSCESLDAEIRTWRGERRWMRLLINADSGDGRRARIFGSKQDIAAHLVNQLALPDRLQSFRRTAS
jgi:hypothetical protein